MLRLNGSTVLFDIGLAARITKQRPAMRTRLQPCTGASGRAATSLIWCATRGLLCM